MKYIPQQHPFPMPLHPQPHTQHSTQPNSFHPPAHLAKRLTPFKELWTIYTAFALSVANTLFTASHALPTPLFTASHDLPVVLLWHCSSPTSCIPGGVPHDPRSQTHLSTPL